MLYNEERPQKFKDAVGQEATKMVLRAQVRKNAFSQAYMFAGHHGSGKTTFARILGKAAVCEHPVDGEPCNECEACRNFSASMDVVEIDAASNTGVDAIRDKVIDAVRYSPVMMKRKIIIIDECHMLSASAFNALLKTLEEPPKNVIIFLCTTELHKVPKTIVSRCQKFIFSGISADEVTEHVLDVSKKHGFTIEEKAARAIAKAADGSMRDALSLLEQASSEGSITYRIVEDMLGNGNMEIVDDIITYTGNGEFAKAAQAVDTFLGASDINHLIDSMLDRIIERVVDGDSRDYLEILDKLGQIRGRSATVATLKAVIYSMSAKEDRIGALERQVEELAGEVELLRNMSQNEPLKGIAGNNDVHTENMEDEKSDNAMDSVSDMGYQDIPEEVWRQDFDNAMQEESLSGDLPEISDDEKRELESMGFTDVSYEDAQIFPGQMSGNNLNDGLVQGTSKDPGIKMKTESGWQKDTNDVHEEENGKPVVNEKPKYRSPFDW